MVRAILMVAEAVGAPDQVAAPRFEDAPGFTQMGIDVVGVQMLDHGSAYGAVEHLFGKLKANRVHFDQLDPLCQIGRELADALPCETQDRSGHIDADDALRQFGQRTSQIAAAAAEYHDSAVASADDFGVKGQPPAPAR